MHAGFICFEEIRFDCYAKKRRKEEERKKKRKREEGKKEEREGGRKIIISGRIKAERMTLLKITAVRLMSFKI